MPGRDKEYQELFDALGEVKYKELMTYNRKLRQRKRDDERKDDRVEYFKDYRKTPQEIKRCVLKSWRRYGITFGEMTDSFFYDVIYIPATQCQSCNKTFDKTTKNDQKQADHKHDPLNPCNIRGVICFQCNANDNWKKRLTPDSIYNQYLTKPPLTDTLINTNENSTDKA